MTSEQRSIRTILKPLIYKLFIGECELSEESKSGMLNQILTDHYKLKHDQQKKIYLEVYEKSKNGTCICHKGNCNNPIHKK